MGGAAQGTRRYAGDNQSTHQENDMPTDTSIATDKLVADLREVAADAEELLKLTAGQAGDRIAELRSSLGAKLVQARSDLGRLEHELLARGRDAARATDQYVHDNPWKAIGASAGLAFLLGLLVGRK
jgi:ElaB/YqjD/DUF883 family membrane-anchored ribosome-binding protein